MPTLVFALQLDISFPVKIQMFEVIVVSGIEGLYMLILSTYRIAAKCRLCSKKGLSKCVLPKADTAEAEGCQDPRHSFFFLPCETCQSYMVAICRPFLDQASCSLEA